jgi:uncharacterized membrane protein YfcA
MDHGSAWLLALIAVVTFALSFVGAAVGLVLGHLRLPMLIAYLGSPGAGVATNLIVSASGAVAGSARHARAGRVSWAGLALMGIPSAVGAIVAVLIFIKINPLWSYLVIGVMLIYSGVKMIRAKPVDPPPGEISFLRRVVVEVVIGLGLGALAAITGLMMGGLRLPMMIRYLRMDPKTAVGTNLAVGALTGIVGAVTAFAAGRGGVNWLLLGVVVPPTLIGAYAGGWLTGKFTKEVVQKLTGWIVTVTGVILLAQAGRMAVRKPHRHIPPPLIERQEPDYIDAEDFFDYDEAEPEVTEQPMLEPQDGAVPEA